MKKYLSVLILLILIVPYVALASWWNPLSWNMFSFLHKKEVIPQVQVEVQKTPEEKINELQKQLDDLKNKQPVSASLTTTPAIKEVKKDTTGNKAKPVVSSSSILPTTTSTKTGYELCSESFQNGTWDGTYKSDGKLNCICQNGYTPNSDGTACQINNQKTQIQYEYQAMLDKIDEKEKARLQAEEDRKNSPECKSATKDLEKIKKEMKPLQEEEDERYEKYLKTGEYVSSNSDTLRKLANLSIRESALNSRYYAACENYYPTPTKTTTCSFIGNTMYCQ